MWWNPIGFGVTFGTGWLLSRRDPLIGIEPELVAIERDPLAPGWLRQSSFLLAGTFLALLVLSAALPWLL